MEPAYYLASIAADGAEMAVVAEGHLDAPVPGCPDWDVAALVGHLGRVWSWVTAIVRLDGQAPDRNAAQQPPEDRAELMPWFSRQRQELLAELTARPPEEAAWNFVADSEHTVGWWLRRQALEVAVHRYDAESASGQSHQIDPDLAVEGIDELLTGFVPRMLNPKPDGLTGTFHVHSTDAPGEWSIDFTGTAVTVTKEHSKADAAARGPAAGLYLWLNNRLDPAAAGIEVFGDQAVLDAWRQVKF